MSDITPDPSPNDETPDEKKEETKEVACLELSAGDTTNEPTIDVNVLIQHEPACEKTDDSMDGTIDCSMSLETLPTREIKAMLKKQKLSTSGSKAELLSRLCASRRQNDARCT